MKIEYVSVNNWDGPFFWDEVKAKPDEPIIAASMRLVLSWNEYQKMLQESHEAEAETTAEPA